MAQEDATTTVTGTVVADATAMVVVVEGTGTATARHVEEETGMETVLRVVITEGEEEEEIWVDGEGTVMVVAVVEGAVVVEAKNGRAWNAGARHPKIVCR